MYVVMSVHYYNLFVWRYSPYSTGSILLYLSDPSSGLDVSADIVLTCVEGCDQIQFVNITRPILGQPIVHDGEIVAPSWRKT